jgi:hypothetical protein
MSAALFPITIEQGVTFTLPLSFTLDGAPLDVSTWTFEGQIRSDYSDPTILASFVFTAGLSSNEVTASITAANTALIPVNPATNFEVTPTLYCYDIIATLPDHVTVTRYMYGPVVVSPEVTT